MRFIESEVERLVSKRLLLDGKVSPKTKRKIIETLTNGAQGMFRWVEMSLETLKRIKFLPDFKKALGQLPSELAGLYDIIHSQIERTEPYGQKVAIRTLSWLLCAQRLLSAEELIAAVYILDDDVSSDSDDDPDFKAVGSPRDDILRLCRNLIVFDSEQKIFRFAHQSVREYLMNLSRYTILEQHALAAERCLEIYLTESRQDPVTREEERQNTILESYAENYWPVHYKHAQDSTSVELRNKFLRFTDQTQGTLAPYVKWRSDIRRRYWYDSSSRRCSYIHLGCVDIGVLSCCVASHSDTLLAVASIFGFTSFLNAYKPSTGLNQVLILRDGRFTLLSLAVRGGHDQVVQLLLDKGADRHGCCGIALRTAFDAGQNQILQMLLDQGYMSTHELPRVLKRDLLLACERSHVPTVRLLLERGADVNARHKDHPNALEIASSHGHYEIVQLLLDHGGDVNAAGGYDGNALQRAVYGGDNHMVQLLLDYGADVNAAPGGAIAYALQMASSRGDDSIVQLLLDRGADINAEGRYGNALQRALREGCRDSIIQMLLDRGADADGVDKKALQERCVGGQISLPSRLKHLFDA